MKPFLTQLLKTSLILLLATNTVGTLAKPWAGAPHDKSSEDLNASSIATSKTNSNGDINSGTVALIDLSNDEETIRSIQQITSKAIKPKVSGYVQRVNNSTWSPDMKVNNAMTVKLQALLDWNHSSPGPIDGNYGSNTKKALLNFQQIKSLPATGKMDQATWDALNQSIDPNKPVLIFYTITQEDTHSPFVTLPESTVARAKLKGLYYESMAELLSERFHMDMDFLKKLNQYSNFNVGDTITVVNTHQKNQTPITQLQINTKTNTLYTYHNDTMIAAYPISIGNEAADIAGVFTITVQAKMPWYRANVDDGHTIKTYILPPGPNNPVGVAWLGLSNATYGIHGMPTPEGVGRKADLGAIHLTNWDILDIFNNVSKEAIVEIKN